MQLFETSSALWLATPWEGGWLWYPFVIYIIIYFLTGYLIWCLVWTRNSCYWDNLIPYLSMMRVALIEDTTNSSSMSELLGEDLRWRAPGVDRTLDNRVLPLSITHRVREYWSPILIGSENSTPLHGLCRVYPSWNHAHKQASLSRILLLIFPMSWECNWGVRPKSFMMQVFYHMTIQGHRWEDC